jgi:hypothetical protein
MFRDFWRNCVMRQFTDQKRSVLRCIGKRSENFFRDLWKYLCQGFGWVCQTFPVILALIVGALAIIAGVSFILVVVHVDELEQAVGGVTTIQLLFGALRLLVGTIGALIAALRYVSERNGKSK